MRVLVGFSILLSLLVVSATADDASAQLPDTSVITRKARTDDLEIQKLEAEIAKLQMDRSTGLIVPALSAISILVLAISLVVQRQTALKIQRLSEQTNFELKVADLLMSSPSPTTATARMNVLDNLYKDRLRPGFKDRFNEKDYRGPRYHELRLELFKQMSSKSASSDEVLEVFKQVFGNEKAMYLEIKRGKDLT